MSEKTAKDRVRELLLDSRGPENAISSREINEVIDEDNVGSFPQTREIVRELLIEEQLPIASGGNGYYIVETEDQAADYADTLASRMTAIGTRRHNFLQAVGEWDGEIESSDDEDIL